MTIRRKYSRRIVVDGISYRWVVRPRATWNDIHAEIEEPGGAALVVVIEHAGSPGAKLIVTTDQARTTRWSDVTPFGPVLSGSITPSSVENWIREALANGWVADRPGPQLERAGVAVIQ